MLFKKKKIYYNIIKKEDVIMSDKGAKVLVIAVAIFLLLSGFGLYVIFEKQGYATKDKNIFVTYDIKDYIETKPVVFNNYSDVYESINVSTINIKNIPKDNVQNFLDEEEKLIEYITGYYNEIKLNDNYIPINSVYTNIKTQINGTVLSIFYQINFKLDEQIFDNSERSYFITTNIDLGTEKVMTIDDLLSKFNYSKAYIAEKIFEEDVLISNGQVVIDKDTNISLTKSDIERKKTEYVDRIISEFDNIIKMYIENNSLALVYDKQKLNSTFFDNKFDTDIKIRYLK